MKINNLCKNCSNWNRESAYDWPNKDRPLKIGQCKIMESDVNYLDSNDVVNDKVSDGKIGCENLYTNENFGCIHFLK